MFKFRLFDLLEATWHLEVAQEESKKKSESGVGKLSDQDQVLYQQDVNRMRALCENFQLESALDQLGRMNITITRGSLQGAYKTFTDQTQQLWECLKTDLDKRVFMFMPLVEAQYYDQDELFGPEVKTRFPKANKEIISAGNCYATGTNTACVFHLMRAVELGARTMFKGMRATKHLKRPMTLCTWGELTAALDEGLKGLTVGKRSRTAKANTFQFYSHAVGVFKHFKGAWRDPVSHTGRFYKPGETKDIVNNTRQFMQHLATRLRE